MVYCSTLFNRFFADLGASCVSQRVAGDTVATPIRPRRDTCARPLDRLLNPCQRRCRF